jgi:hypothetical protein
MKQKAIAEVKDFLMKQQNDIQFQIRMNKREMKKLADKQTILKRQLPIFTDLINKLK